MVAMMMMMKLMMMMITKKVNDDDKETDSDRTGSDRIKIHVLNQSSTEYYEEEEENIDDEETMDDEEDDEVTKELYKDVNQVEEDAHVTLTLVLDAQKTDEPVQSSCVSSDFTSKLLNLENPSPADNEIASLMETSARHAMAVPEITPVSDFATLVIEINVTESLEAAVLARLSETNHLEQIKKKKLYDALVESYKTKKYLFNTYGEVFTLKMSQDDRDKDQDPSAGSDRGTKQRTLSKEAESSRDSRRLRLENLKVRALLCIKGYWVDSFRDHMALSQEEFCQIRRDHDDAQRRLRRLESFVERRLGFRP
ncbi:hypothetical protein Tco_1012843 [Tanacetum coccineum]